MNTFRRIYRVLLLICIVILQSCSISPLLQQRTGINHQSADFFDDTLSLQGIDTGPFFENPIATVFFDPSCPPCRALYAKFLSIRNKITIHWVPVGSRRPEIWFDGHSIHTIAPTFQGSACLISGLPGSNSMDMAMRGIKPECEDPTKWASDAIERNTKTMLLKPLGAVATPTVIVQVLGPAKYVILRAPGLAAEAILGAWEELYAGSAYEHNIYWVLMDAKTHLANIMLTPHGRIIPYSSPEAACHAYAKLGNAEAFGSESSKQESTVCLNPISHQAAAYAFPIISYRSYRLTHPGKAPNH